MSNDRRFGFWLFVASSAAALLVRLVYLFQVREATLFKAPLLDSAFYVSRAWSIRYGDFIGDTVSFHSAPIYPYFISMFMGLAGADQSLWWLRLAQGLISALTVGLLALTALRLFGRWAGVATALLATFYGPFLFFSGEILEITLTLAFLAWALFLLAGRDKPGGLPLFAAGLLLGLAALGKPNILILGPVIWISLGLFRPLGRPSAWEWRRGILLAAGILVAVLPFTLRNKLAGDDWVLISSNGGINLFIGNNPQADGGFYVPSSMATDLRGSSRIVAEEARGRELRPSEVSRFWTGRALKFFRTRPAHAMGLITRKAGLLLNHYEIPNHYSYYFFREYYAPILRLPLTSWSMVLPLGLLGLALGLRGNVRARRQAWSLLAVALTVVLFFVTSRYRLPAALMLFPFAGHGLALLGRAFRDRRWKALGGALLILIAGSAMAHLPMVEKKDFHDDFMTISSFWFQQKDFEKGAFYSTEAIRQRPASAPAWHNLGFAYLQGGDFLRAEDCLWKAVEYDPNFGHAYSTLGSLYIQYVRPFMAEKCIDKAESLTPILRPHLKQVRQQIPVSREEWETEANMMLNALDLRAKDQPGRAEIMVEKAQVLGFRLERHAEALAVLDSIPPDAVPDSQSFREQVEFMKDRLIVARDHMRYLR